MLKLGVFGSTTPARAPAATHRASGAAVSAPTRFPAPQRKGRLAAWHLPALALAALALAATALAATALALLSQAEEAGPAYQLEEVATGLSDPWSLAFLPDGRMLLSELSGNFRIIGADGQAGEPLGGVPEVVFASQGGLSDVILDPDFRRTSRIFFSYSARDRGQDDAITLFVARATLVGNSLHDLEVILRAKAPRQVAVHMGAKLAWLPDGTLLVASGDGFDYREQAQSLDNHFGKILRINRDGTVPADNPFIDTPGALPEIYSYGHRNMQALLVAEDGAIYEHEHGPRGGDELNLIQPGRNYGWPLICHCLDYNFAVLTPFTEAPGMEQPLHYWRPSIAPAGMALYTAEKFPAWRGSFFVAGLMPGDVRRLEKSGDGYDEEVLFAQLGRIRNIYQTPGGDLMILTDGPNGKLVRVAPARGGR